MAKEQVDACTKVLRHIYSPTQQKVLYSLPLVYRVASLNIVVAVVFIRGIVKLAPLPATLLKEVMNSHTTRVLYIAVAVRNLQLLQLNHGYDIGIDYTLCKQ